MMNKLSIFKIYFTVVGIFLFFWWPASHWFYPDAYHSLLGFESYDLPMVRVIGTLSLFSVIGIYFVVRDPLRNRDFFITLMVMSILMSATFLFLIWNGSFPAGEYIDVGLLAGNGIISALLYPWQQANQFATEHH